jgi:hypothetical protein
MWRHGLRILNYDTSRGGIRWRIFFFSISFSFFYRQRTSLNRLLRLDCGFFYFIPSLYQSGFHLDCGYCPSSVTPSVFFFSHLPLLIFKNLSIRKRKILLLLCNNNKILIWFFVKTIQCQNGPVALRGRQSSLHRQRQSTGRRELYVQHLGIVVDHSRRSHSQRYTKRSSNYISILWVWVFGKKEKSFFFVFSYTFSIKVFGWLLGKL